jgi:hypothetical protein
VLEEEATMASLFPGFDGDESGSVVAGHDEQSRRGVERSRVVARRHIVTVESPCAVSHTRAGNLREKLSGV